MPYLDGATKIEVDATGQLEKAGALTYKIQQQLKKYLEQHGESYQTYAEIMGALEGARLDLIERKVKPYEQRKLLENGDVW